MLNGRLIGTDTPVDPVFLSNLDEDMGERVNLKDSYPEIAEEMREAALAWRAQIEAREFTI